jgi:hypothetical protein
MIVRYWLKCGVCEKPHTVRIGVGLDASQTHKFPCCGCKEEIVLRMDLDHAKAGWRIVCVENCEPIHEAAGAPFVNLDPNFVIPAEQQGTDMVFPRLGQMLAMHEASRSAPRSRFAELVPPTNRNFRPYRQPDYGAEWKLLRRAWSLARNGQTELSEKQVGSCPAIQKAAYKADLKDVEQLIVKAFSSALSDEEKTLLEQCRQLRNKLLHCDFHALRKKLAEQGAGSQRGDVKRVDIAGLSGTRMAAKIREVATGAPGSFEYVGETPAKAGTVFGWLFDAGISGNFKEAASSFARAAGVIDRLAMI